MEKLSELDIIVLARSLPEHGLEVGDVGTIVHIYQDGTVVEAEFVTGEGETVAVLTLSVDDVRVMQRREILHVRQMAA